ncbi:uncharacterized protein DFL_003742 [Arthrobotrys flagrans]|uniref:Uncharacterized protein n=1 Tax=Arthrobotrys flagrans TaxID=97331 RepID=A0A437A2Q3_ARTFL|nr:hypothetical protein DFL_003742 [Arthrobotrys flagrans]
MTFSRSTTGGCHVTRNNSSKLNNPSPANPNTPSQRPTSSYDQIGGAKIMHCRVPPPPSDSRLRLIHERPETVPRCYVTSYQIQQYFLEDCGVSTIYFCHIVEALEKALENAPCPASFGIKLDRLCRLEAKWCQQVSHVLRQNIHPKVLEFLEDRFTKELGYYLFCLAQNCSDTISEGPAKKSTTNTESQSSATLEDYVVLNSDGTLSSGGNRNAQTNTPTREPRITSSCGRSRAYFEIPAPRSEKALIRTLQDCSCSPPITTSTETEDDNNHVNREVLVDRNRQREQGQKSLHHGFTESQGWILICILAGLVLGYFCDFRPK